MRRFALVFICLFFSLSTALAAVPAAERSALVALYNSTNGPAWTDHSNWLSGDPCDNEWYGIYCESRTNVNRIDLYENNLVGTIPDTLGNLSKLNELGMSDNQLSGSIPATLGNLENLTYLWLNYNQLSGSIPTALGDLAKLDSLALYQNQLTGTIPATLGNLSVLNYLNLENNKLSGVIPNSLGNLSELWELYLNDNMLSGSIPASLGNLTKLYDLELHHNQLSGVIPTTLGNLARLTTLNLHHNQLSGPIPAILGNLSGLWRLSLSNNQLSGPIPATLGKLSELAGGLYLANNQLSGAIPAELGDMTKLDNLSLQNNMLSGPIPTSLAKLTKMQVLRLYGNQLSGPVPAGFINFDQLSLLNLNWNALYTNNTNLDDFLDTESKSDWSSSQTIPPKSLRVTGAGPNSVSLAWKPIEYMADGGGYRAWYATKSGGPYMNGGFKANKNSNSHTVSGLTPGQKYYFVVRSQTNSHSDNANTVVSKNSVQVSGQTTGASGSPTQPTGVRATDGTYSNKVRVTFNTVAGATVYRVFRCLNTGATCGSPVGYPKAGIFDDLKADPGTVYYYRVRACTPSTCSKFSVANAGFISTEPAKPTGIKATDGTWSNKVRVTFNTVAGATVYRVFRCLTTGATCGSPVGYPKAGIFDDLKGAPGTVYYYRVRACTPSTCGRFSVANAGHRKTVPTRPIGIKASDGTYPLRVRVTWNKFEGATVYRVFRCQTTGQTCGLPVAYQKVPVLDDFRGKSGVVYYYRVRACTATKCSLFSAANSGYRGSLPSTEADEGTINMNDVPIPALNDVGRWILILMTMGLGWLLMRRRYGVK